MLALEQPAIDRAAGFTDRLGPTGEQPIDAVEPTSHPGQGLTPPVQLPGVRGARCVGRYRPQHLQRRFEIVHGRNSIEQVFMTQHMFDQSRPSATIGHRRIGYGSGLGRRKTREGSRRERPAVVSIGRRSSGAPPS
ncbi:MAG: hypothetical protein ACKO91_13555 [Acidimicrobiales bacterium]